MIARSSRDRSSRRAASSAWIVGGTAAAREVARRRSIGRRAMDEALVHEHRDELRHEQRDCPRTSRRRERVTAASTAPPSRTSTSSAVPLGSSAGIGTVRDVGFECSSRAASRVSRRRPVATTSTADCGAVASRRWSRRSRNVSSALWTSSINSDDGPLRRQRLEELAGAPEELRDREAGRREADDGGEAVADLACPPGRPRAAAPILSSGLSGVSSSTMPAAARTTSTSGQKVMPSPYGRQRPAEHGGRGCDLLPGSLDEVGLARRRPRRRPCARRAPPRLTTSRSAGSELARAASSRPTSGASRGRRAGSSSRCVPDAEQPNAGTRSALPLSSRGSTASTSTCARTRS